MDEAIFRIHAGLNGFLPIEKQNLPYVRPFKGPVTVKHLIESIGIPHTDVELLVTDGRSIGLSYLVQAGDVIEVYPAGCALEITPQVQLRPELSPPYRFILDNHLGKLSTYLRLLGFDSLYQNSYDDEVLARISHDQERILLTRDRALLKRRLVVHGFCLHTRDPKNQLRAVIKRFALHDHIRPWRRCLRCNSRLQTVTKEEIWHRLEPKTQLYYDEFHICLICDQVYWKGSHYAHMQAFLDGLGPMWAE